MPLRHKHFLFDLKVCCFIILWIYGCADGKFSFQQPKYLPPVPVNAKNKPTAAQIRLGKKLFFDKKLSVSGKIACASCHKPQFAFADTVAISKGIGHKKSNRNTPSLVNIAYHPYYFAEGGVATLELQVLGPLSSKSEMGINLKKAIQYLNANSFYIKMFKKVYGKKATVKSLVLSLSNYQRSIVSGYSRYDLFKKDAKKFPLSSAEKLGMILFFSDSLACSQCHTPPLFTNYAFQNVGLKVKYADKGRWRITGKRKDIGKFKTPSLRNIGITAPYMHDGSMPDLDSVIAFYASSGKPHFAKSDQLQSFVLSKHQSQALKAFLLCLTDTHNVK